MDNLNYNLRETLHFKGCRSGRYYCWDRKASVVRNKDIMILNKKSINRKIAKLKASLRPAELVFPCHSSEWIFTIERLVFSEERDSLRIESLLYTQCYKIIG